MAWKVRWLNDTDNPDEGTAIATWTDNDGSGMFVHQDRLNQKQLDDFVGKAKALLAEQQDKKAAVDKVAATIEAELNK